MAQVLQALSDAHNDCRQLINDATTRRNAANDGKAGRFKELAEGDTVLLHVPRTPAGTTLKLGRPWRGPYRVSKKHSPVNYTIMPLAGGPGKVIHVSRLKLFRGDPGRLGRRAVGRLSFDLAGRDVVKHCLLAFALCVCVVFLLQFFSNYQHGGKPRAHPCCLSGFVTVR
eukprot:m.225002 g.225002  ORF g.225002 m.225002 type:complete len:170 (-) comp17038_c0_seq3:174-683(-)